MSVLDQFQAINIWLYVGPLLIIAVLILIFLVRRHREEHAMARLVAVLIRKKEAGKKDLATYEELTRHRQTLLINEAMFFLALLFLALAYVKEDWIVMGIGSVVMALTLFVLSLLLTHPESEPSHHLLRMFDGASNANQETVIAKHVGSLLRKEKILREKEKVLSTQFEMLYKMATMIDHKDASLRAKIKRMETEPAPDIKKVLLMQDELLEKLPDEAISKFVNSDNYAVYKKVMDTVK